MTSRLSGQPFLKNYDTIAKDEGKVLSGKEYKCSDDDNTLIKKTLLGRIASEVLVPSTVERSASNENNL